MSPCRVTVRSALYDGSQRFTEVASIMTASGSVIDARGPLGGTSSGAARGAGASPGALHSGGGSDGAANGPAGYAGVSTGIFTLRRGGCGALRLEAAAAARRHPAGNRRPYADQSAILGR